MTFQIQPTLMDELKKLKKKTPDYRNSKLK